MTLDLCLMSRHFGNMLIYKIMTTDQYEGLVKTGRFEGAPIDLQDGYIHLSAGDQVDGTLAKHFAGVDGLVLLALEADTLGDDLKWEVSRGHALFPHLYRTMTVEDVVWFKPLTPDDHPSGFTPIWV